MYDLIIENVNNIYPLYEENNRLSKKGATYGNVKFYCFKETIGQLPWR